MLNVKLLKFLVSNQAALIKIVEIAKGWRKDLPYEDQWGIVDAIARIVIPMLKSQAVSASAITGDDNLGDYEDYDALIFQAGSEFAAMNIDWKLLADVILPIIISILQALAAGTKD